MLPKSIEDLIRSIFSKDINLNGRRIGGAGRSLQNKDYVTQQQLIDMGIEIGFGNSQKINAVSPITVPDDPYAVGWNGSREVPTKNAIYDKVEALIIEGTWTPTVLFGGASVGVTYGAQKGTYQKVKNWAKVNGYIILTNKGASVGNLQIGNLPFTAENVANQYANASIWVNNTNGIVGNHVQAVVNPNSVVVALSQLIADVANVLTNTEATNTSEFMFSAMYKTV